MILEASEAPGPDSSVTRSQDLASSRINSGGSSASYSSPPAGPSRGLRSHPITMSPPIHEYSTSEAADTVPEPDSGWWPLRAEEGAEVTSDSEYPLEEPDLTHSAPADVPVGLDFRTPKQTTMSEPVPMFTMPPKLGTIPATPSISSTASHRTSAIDRLASAAIRSFGSATSGPSPLTSRHVDRTRSEEVAEAPLQPLQRLVLDSATTSDVFTTQSEPALRCRTFNLAEAMELIDSGTTTTYENSSDVIHGFMDRSASFPLEMDSTTGRSASTDGPLMQMQSNPSSEFRSPSPQMRERLDTGASIASLRRDAENMLETPRDQIGGQEEEDTSGLKTPAFCTPSPVPLKTSPPEDTPRDNLLPITAKDTRAIVSLSYLMDSNPSISSAGKEGEGASSAAGRSSMSSFVFAPAQTSGPAKGSHERSSLEHGRHPSGGQRGGQEASSPSPRVAVTANGALPSIPHEGSPDENREEHSLDDPAPSQEPTPRPSGSLLRRLKSQAWQAVKNLSPSSGRAGSQDASPFGEVRDISNHERTARLPLQQQPCEPPTPMANPATPRGSYTVTLQDWPTPEDSPVHWRSRARSGQASFGQVGGEPLLSGSSPRGNEQFESGAGSPVNTENAQPKPERKGKKYQPRTPAASLSDLASFKRVPYRETLGTIPDVDEASVKAASQRSIAVFRRPKSSASSPRHERGSPSARSTASTTNDRQREAAFAMADTSGEQSAAAASEAPFTDAPADGWVQRRPARTDDAAAQRWRTRIEKCLNEPLRAPEPRRRSEPQTEIQPDVPPEAAEPLAPVTPGLEESLQTRYKAYLSGQLPPPRIGAETLPPTREAGLERRVSLDSRECAPASLGVILMEESGNKYEGQIGSNGLEGRGVLFFDGGGSYAGQWQNSAYEGAGIETFANGSHYVGEFCQGKQHGRGVCYYADGTTYGGEWTAGVQEGLGSQDTAGLDGFFYVGSYRGGVRHGLGVAGFATGEEFSGELEEDAPHGYGVAHFGGRKGTYEGQWLSGVRHGWAVSTLSNGSMWAGQWVLGKACWLAQLCSNEDGEMPNVFLEAMDLCEEAGRLARAAGMAAVAQAKSIRIPGGTAQAAIHKATRAGVAAAREAHIQRQKAQLFYRPPGRRPS